MIGGAATSPPDVLTVDYEDWFNLMFDRPPDTKQWERFPRHVESDTLNLLDLLDGFGARATFFAVGWVAERSPDMIREIVRRGHRLGSHGYLHVPPQMMGEADFRRDLIRSLDVLQRIAGTPVIGYRAPGFGIRACRFPFFRVLRECGIRYDSSHFPGAFPGRGFPRPMGGSPAFDGKGRMWEIPVSAVSVMRVPVVFSGGGFLRLFPLWFIRWGAGRTHRIGEPVVYYLHPRDLNPRSPKLATSWWRGIRHYGGRVSTRHKLSALFADRPLISIESWLRVRTASVRSGR
jgi:polysaccharide deacetylase family protein (PEP-CTERM system associated)